MHTVGAASACEAHTPSTFISEGFDSPDVYFTAGYGEAEQASGAGQWTSLVAHEGLWQMPLHIRDSPVGRDTLSPYGYAGVYASARLTSSDRKNAWQQATSILREQGVLSIFLRQSPLLEDPFHETPGRVVVAGHPTVRLDTRSADSAWNGMLGRSRTSIRKADRNGLSTTLRPALAADLEAMAPFRSLYESAMRRREAASRYFFPDDYYSRLSRGLTSDLLIGMTTNADGRPVAAALFMRHGRTLHYHLSGAEPEAGRAGATNQLIWEAVRWASLNNVTSLHLGGGVAARDSLFDFKRSFGGEVLGFNAFGVILDEAAYDDAVAARARELGKSVATLSDSEYFPRFRASA